MRTIVSVQDGANRLAKRCVERFSAGSPLLTSDVAFLLDVSIATVKRWADLGRLPSARVGKKGSRRRFILSDVVAFSRAAAESTPPEPEQEVVNA